MFGDSLNSMHQAAGWSHLNNHHPVMYTLFIRFCLWLGDLVGQRALGVAFYCVVQMAIMSAVLSYLVCWVRVRFGLHVIWSVIFVAVFGLVPYYATYSIALWKDPVFSCALVALSLLLADLAFSGGRASRRKTWIWAAVIWCLVMEFTRNNGAYIVALCALACFFAWRSARRRKAERKSDYRGAFISLGGAALVGLLVCGPVWHVLGISGRASESVGIPLNQIANVVVHDGEMTDSDREYLDQILPLERYSEVYDPRLVDPFKNKGNFAGKYSELPRHWLSLMMRNPDLYLEAWVLETYGFWTVNRPEVWSYDGNIMAGVPRNVVDKWHHEIVDLDIEASNLLGNDAMRNWLPLRSLQPPVGVIFWATVYLALCLVYSRRRGVLLALLPTFGLMVTLLIATPIWYWPRYALAVQLLLPLYVGLFYLVFRRRCKDSTTGDEGQARVTR